MTHKILQPIATVTAITLVLAAYFAALKMPYPMLQDQPYPVWVIIAAGCLFSILLPALGVLGLLSFGWFGDQLIDRILRHLAATPESATIPTAPAAAPAADIDAEWSDIITEMEKSK